MRSDIIAWSTFDYFPNASKSWLVIAEKHSKSDQLLFTNTCVNYGIGAAIGSATYIIQYVSSKVSSWVQELQLWSTTHSLLCIYSRANQ